MSNTGDQGAQADAAGAPGTQTSKRETGKAKLRHASQSLRSQARRYADDAQQLAEVAEGRTLEAVRERPMTVIGSAGGIALLAGLVLGFFVGQAFTARR